jgi:ribosomal protein L9
MDNRVRKSRRILSARQQLHRIEQWKLAQLQARVAELETEQIELIGALNDTNALHGLFIDTMARRLGTLAEETGRVTIEKDAKARELAEHAVGVKLAEQLAKAVAREVHSEEERKRLLDVIDQFVTWNSTSLP